MRLVQPEVSHNQSVRYEGLRIDVCIFIARFHMRVVGRCGDKMLGVACAKEFK